jgi:small subunit ribosomal protein S6
VSAATSEKPVKQNLYEGMFLVDSGKFAMDSAGITEAILGVLEKGGATIVAHRPWQDGKLAYEIEGMRKGLHYIVCFTMPGEGMTTVTRQCQLNEHIVRQMIIKHPQEIFDATVAAISGQHAESEDAAEAPAKEESDT